MLNFVAYIRALLELVVEPGKQPTGNKPICHAPCRADNAARKCGLKTPVHAADNLNHWKTVTKVCSKHAKEKHSKKARCATGKTEADCAEFAV